MRKAEDDCMEAEDDCVKVKDVKLFFCIPSSRHCGTLVHGWRYLDT